MKIKEEWVISRNSAMARLLLLPMTEHFIQWMRREQKDLCGCGMLFLECPRICSSVDRRAVTETKE